jgi:hypothetical protein
LLFNFQNVHPKIPKHETNQEADHNPAGARCDEPVPEPRDRQTHARRGENPGGPAERAGLKSHIRHSKSNIPFPSSKSLKQGNFLKKFPSQETLRNIASELTYETLSAEKLLFRQGETGDKFYIILSGQVNGYMSWFDGRNFFNQIDIENPTFTLGPGMAFGEGA